MVEGAFAAGEIDAGDRQRRSSLTGDVDRPAVVAPREHPLAREAAFDQLRLRTVIGVDRDPVIGTVGPENEPGVVL